ncbi:P-loop containing nucleoside triphosphate hydrolase protein [Flammula alnicola]|nr:P-loop containing nucleoside triphosphate hydrolase protein [Flammula alnicola]
MDSSICQTSYTGHNWSVSQPFACHDQWIWDEHPWFPWCFSDTPREDPLVTNLVFIPLARKLGSVPGVLVDSVQFGAFTVPGSNMNILFIQSKFYPAGFGTMTQFFILHEGPEEVSRLFLLSAGAWADSLHDEIWVFNQGFWQKNHGLWTEVQKADWKDVILKEEFKKALQKDVYGFFASEAIYKELAIPWKRGLIMYGPPGNGKTISLKTIMKTCGAQGFAPLYVKSFQSYKGEEGAMADVFDKARQLAPCVVVLEDLDSLINDRNRSFFLNQLDGLEGNDGLLIIGTTNHFDRLDPGLSTRPSRFDRKYEFDDPDEEERKLYAQYWQNKLQSNKEIEFPDRLVNKVARLTDRFSFAYLKEAFVSTLVTFVGIEGEKPTFESVLTGQIEALRKQLDKQFSKSGLSSKVATDANSTNSTMPYPAGARPNRPSRPDSSNDDVHALLDALSECAPRVDPIRSRLYRSSSFMDSPAGEQRNNRDFRDLLDALSDSVASLDFSRRAYEATPSGHPDRHQGSQADHERGRRIRELMDRISAQTENNFGETRFYSHSPSNIPTPGAQPEWIASGPLPGLGHQPISPQGSAGLPLEIPSRALDLEINLNTSNRKSLGTS